MDVDRDGQVDAGWTLHDLGNFGLGNRGLRSDASSRIYANLRIREAGSPPINAFVVIDDVVHGDAYCAGTPNSTGLPAQLTAFGQDAVDLAQ